MHLRLRKSNFTRRVTQRVASLLLTIWLLWATNLQGQELYIGTATADISPALPVALLGQFHLRIADTAETPLIANVMALESREGGRSIESVIFVACDLTVITPALIAGVRKEVSRRVAGLDVTRIILTATHTHTAPVLGNENLTYPIPETGVTQIQDYLLFAIKRISDGIEKAWSRRQPGSITWGFSHAVVGYNRRSVYANGTASLYGGTHVPHFRNIEGPEDHDVNTLFFWNKAGKLIAMNITIGCPAQEVEGRSAVNADFWHEARKALQKRFGADVCVIGWVGAAGDQSPRLMYRRAAEERMHKLRNITRMEEMGRRIANAVEDAYSVVRNDRHATLPMVHMVDTLMLPWRLMSDAEYTEAKAGYSKLFAQIEADPKMVDKVGAQMIWYRDAATRFENQNNQPRKFEAEVHVVRIGDVVICTSPFELFADFGIRIQARSKAVQTFVVQLAGAGNYVPTEKAVKGGGYSVIMQSSWVGPDGGDILVDRTVEMIDKQFPPLPPPVKK